MISSRQYELLHHNWRQLGGTEFEDFLANVFQALGFEVTRTGRTGDAGLDLLVVGKGKRLAVQAKGYPSGASAGTAAVQEAGYSKLRHNCDEAIAITNTYFSGPAKRAAMNQDTGETIVTLIDQSEIENLISGKLY